MIVSLLGVALVGCAVKRDQYDTPVVPLPDRYQHATPSPEAAVVPSALPADPPLPAPELDRRLAEWWRLLENRELDGLIDRAVANNQDLRIAAQRVVQAKARAEQAAAGRLPEVTAPVQHRVEAPRDGIGSVAKGGEIKTEHTYQASLRGDWRVDLWGERRSLAESAELELWQAVFQHDDRRRKLIGEVVDAYVEYLSLNDRSRVARETERVLREMLEAMEARLEKGDATITDLEQQRAAVHGVRATLPALELRREQVANRLAMLTGGVPRGLTLSDEGLDALRRPPLLPGVPSTLLLHRPDVRAVEARLLAADADIDAARARLLPSIDLTAQVGYGSLHLAELFQPQTLFWNFIANLSASIFDAGKGEREVDYARAVHEEMVENYVKVIYGAVLEVEDALASVELNGRRLEIQHEATGAAERAWRYSREAYGLGAIDYLTLLDTVRTYHRNLDDLHRFRMESYQGLVELFAALGGGVPDRSPLPGEGGRPTEAGGAVTGAADSSSDGWRPFQWQRRGEGWLVELSGIHGRDGAEATWRDLVERYPAMVGGRALLARLAQETVVPEGGRATWYRLFVDGFDGREVAERWCETLRAEQQRCRVVTSETEQSFAGRFPWPVAEEGGQPEVAGPPPSLEGFAVQLGTYSSEERAHSAVAQWRAKGYRPFVYRVAAGEGRVWHTVRIAPAIDREVVERDAAALTAAERGGAIVVRQAVDADGQPDRMEGFAVQLGYFSEYGAASAAAALWRAKGYEPYVARVERDGGERRYAVRLAPGFERALAVAEMNAFAEREGAEAIVVGETLDALGRPRGSMGYAVQLGTFRIREGAERTAARWREKGYRPYVCEVEGREDEPWYTVRLGASPRRDWVQEKAAEFERREGAAVLVVPAELDSRGDPRAVPAVVEADEGEERGG